MTNDASEAPGDERRPSAAAISTLLPTCARTRVLERLGVVAATPTGRAGRRDFRLNWPVRAEAAEHGVGDGHDDDQGQRRRSDEVQHRALDRASCVARPARSRRMSSLVRDRHERECQPEDHDRHGAGVSEPVAEALVQERRHRRRGVIGPPRVVTQTRSKSCSAPMIDKKTDTRMVGASSGSVTWRNVCQTSRRRWRRLAGARGSAAARQEDDHVEAEVLPRDHEEHAVEDDVGVGEPLLASPPAPLRRAGLVEHARWAADLAPHTPVTTSDSTYGAKNSIRSAARPLIFELSSIASAEREPGSGAPATGR